MRSRRSGAALDAFVYQVDVFGLSLFRVG